MGTTYSPARPGLRGKVTVRMALLAPTRSRVVPQPSAGIWPGLFNPPHAPVHAAIARRLVHAAVTSLPLTLRFPDGSRWGAGGPPLQVIKPHAFFSRLGTDGLIGFGEAWMTGEITTGGWPAAGPDAIDPRQANLATDALAEVLTVLAHRVNVLVPRPLQELRRMWQARQPA